MTVRLLPESAGADARRLLAARGLRSLADGFVSILLPVYLLALGLDAFQVGVLSAATLFGSAVLTLLVGLVAARFSRRRLLLAAAALMAATGIGFAVVTDFWPLLIIAFVGTLNVSSGDVTVFLPLEQAMLAQTVADRDRTALFARYSVAGTLAGAVGTLIAAVPELAAERLPVAAVSAMQAMFVLYALIGVAAGLLYRGLAREGSGTSEPATQPLRSSRRTVYKLAALFSVDAFAGGFIVQSLLALWLFQAFELSVAVAGQIFFWSNVLTAVSFLAAVPIARRIGLVNTMVFSHLPANACLVAIPFVGDLWTVIALLMVRSLLSQMDVPTRTSYVMAVVTPAERPATASLTSVPRSLASAASPLLAGHMLAVSGFGWPLMVAGLLKIVYDLALLFQFRHLRPPEERPS
jgi:MFS family permease